MTIKEAEAVWQKAYNIDVGLESGPLNVLEVSAMDLHKVFYDGGLFRIEEIQNLMRKGGMMRDVIEYVIGERVKRGDYKIDTLRKMYFGG